LTKWAVPGTDSDCLEADRVSVALGTVRLLRESQFLAGEGAKPAVGKHCDIDVMGIHVPGAGRPAKNQSIQQSGICCRRTVLLQLLFRKGRRRACNHQRQQELQHAMSCQ
jgi:hypothetical protein